MSLNTGIVLQVLAVVMFFSGIYVSIRQNKPTVFSYINFLKQDNYFDNKRASQLVQEPLISFGATERVTNGLLQVGKMLKIGNVQAAEEVLDGIPKNDLTPTDLTNIQSTRAAIEFAKGNLPAARSIYLSIIDTGTKSNAVFSGMATITAFESLKFYKSDPDKAVALTKESNEWYLKALAGDQRPEVTVHIYYGLFDNYKRLTEYFKLNEIENMNKFQVLFLEANKKAGSPY